MQNSREFPFGVDTDTLIVCRNETHRNAVAKAFGVKAHYAGFGQSLTGRRYAKVIAFLGGSPSEQEERWARERLPLLLPPGSDQLYLL